MKRLTCIILALLLCILSGCTAIDDLMTSFDPASEFSYEGWKIIELSGYGKMKIPKDWILEESDGYYFIKKPGSQEGSYDVVLFQSKAYTTESCDINPLNQEIRLCEDISAHGLSNGPTYGEGRYSIDEMVETRWYIEIHSLNKPTLLFLSDDPSLDEEMIRKLAASVMQGKRNGEK